MPDIAESALPIVTSVGSGDYLRTVYNDGGTMTSALITKGNLIPAALAYILITDTKSANTAGGTFTSGSFATRTLNTEDSDAGGYATLSSNQVSLSAGTYRVRISAPAFAVDQHQAVLYNVTSAANQLIGAPSYSFQSGGSGVTVTNSVIVGRFTIAVTTVFEVRHRCATTKATNGLGVQANFGVNEIYTTFEAWRE